MGNRAQPGAMSASVGQVVNIGEAKTRLSDLVAQVERGSAITIARAGRPVARLNAVHPAPQRVFGLYPELAVPREALLEPMPEGKLALWE